MHIGPDLSGAAALSICESLLLCLTDQKVLSENDVVNIMTDAANAHRNAAGDEHERARSLATAELIQAIIDGGNSVRRR